MNKWILAVGVALLGGAFFVAADAEAKRLGGGRAVGTQRNVTTPPAQQQAAPAKAPQAAQAAPAAPAGSRWAGILGGLALGGLLGYLFGGEGLMGFLLLAALGIGAVMVVRMLMASRASQPAAAAAAGSAKLNLPAEFSAQVPASSSPSAPSAASPALSVASRYPAGFDAEGFLRGAKMNFVKLQLANDRGDLEEIREFTTPELFAQLEADLLARAGRQETDVAELEAQLLDLATEDGRYWASVGFSGLERQAVGAPVRFGEVWNLVKPVDGASGWLLAGIQQMH